MSARTNSITATLALVFALAIGLAAEAAPRPARPSTEVIRLEERHGFDWGDAAIGAAGGLGLAMLALGGGLVITTRRYR
jgi:hypothetical protein